MSTNILITGGTGFIGSHLARQLATSGHRVTVIGRRPQSSSRINSQGRNLTVLQLPGQIGKRAILKVLLD